MRKFEWKDGVIVFVGSIALTLFTGLLFPENFRLAGNGFFVLSCLVMLSLIWLFRWAGGGRFLSIIMVAAFFLRFGGGLFFTLALPVYGYPETTQQAGYLFSDAYQRDSQAWQLAASEAPILSAFTGKTFFSDQYGGLLALSAVVYRFFSPETHFKVNILLVIAFMSTLTIPFVWKALSQKKRFIQITAVLLLAFYPDVILYSAAEMREGIILGLSAALFYLLNKSAVRNIKTILLVMLIVIGLILINLKVAVFIVFAMGVWFFLFNNTEFLLIKKNRWIMLLFSIIMIAFGILSMEWLARSSQWDSVVLVMKSGWIETIINKVGVQYRLPFATIYGFFRPLLPAAMIETSIPIWKVTAIIRAVGWYAVMPIFLFGFVYALRTFKQDGGKNLILWIILLAWILLSSLRAGGDQWDNPRYRINLFVLIAVYLAEIIDYLKQHKDHWFTRIMIALLIFLAFFFYWYINRYIGTFAQIDFYLMIGLIFISYAILFASGLVYEYRN